jgi:outer membrane protein assembly factor BamB
MDYFTSFSLVGIFNFIERKMNSSENIVKEKLFGIFNIRLDKVILILFYVSLCLLSGCAKDIIIRDSKSDSLSYSMYGQNPQRNFHIPITITDSIKLLWQNEIHGSFLSSSVIAFDKYVFVSDKSGRVYAFNVENGKENGYLNYKGFVPASCVLNQFKLVLPICKPKENKSIIHIYNTHLGKELSSVEIEGIVSGDILNLDDGFILVTEQGKVFKIGLNASTIWEYDNEKFIHSSPSANKKVIIFGDDKGYITGISTNKGELIYKKQFKARFESGFTVSGDTAFAGDLIGNVYAIDINSGSLFWKFSASGKITTFPVMDNQFIYIGNLNGNIYKIRKADGKLLWQLKTGGLINTTPILFDNRLIQPDLDNKIYFINTVTGTITKLMETENRPVLTPVYFNNKLFLGTDYGQIFAYEFVK